jgi:hypothetical protein
VYSELEGKVTGRLYLDAAADPSKGGAFEIQSYPVSGTRVGDSLKVSTDIQYGPAKIHDELAISLRGKDPSTRHNVTSVSGCRQESFSRKLEVQSQVPMPRFVAAPKNYPKK